MTTARPPALGTILPGRITDENDAWQISQEKKREAAAVATGELAGCTRRVIGRQFPEVRYYDTDDQYAIVARNGKVLWFAVTPDGDVRIPRREATQDELREMRDWHAGRADRPKWFK